MRVPGLDARMAGRNCKLTALSKYMVAALDAGNTEHFKADVVGRGDKGYRFGALSLGNAGRS